MILRIVSGDAFIIMPDLSVYGGAWELPPGKKDLPDGWYDENWNEIPEPGPVGGTITPFSEAPLQFTIVTRGSRFCVLTKSKPRKTLGCHPTRELAEKQLAAIEASKARGARGGGTMGASELTQIHQFFAQKRHPKGSKEGGRFASGGGGGAGGSAGKAGSLLMKDGRAVGVFGSDGAVIKKGQTVKWKGGTGTVLAIVAGTPGRRSTDHKLDVRRTMGGNEFVLAKLATRSFLGKGTPLGSARKGGVGQGKEKIRAQQREAERARRLR